MATLSHRLWLTCVVAIATQGGKFLIIGTYAQLGSSGSWNSVDLQLVDLALDKAWRTVARGAPLPGKSAVKVKGEIQFLQKHEVNCE